MDLPWLLLILCGIAWRNQCDRCREICSRRNYMPTHPFFRRRSDWTPSVLQRSWSSCMSRPVQAVHTPCARLMICGRESGGNRGGIEVEMGGMSLCDRTLCRRCSCLLTAGVRRIGEPSHRRAVSRRVFRPFSPAPKTAPYPNVATPPSGYPILLHPIIPINRSHSSRFASSRRASASRAARAPAGS